jgi:hypothetical protein
MSQEAERRLRRNRAYPMSFVFDFSERSRTGVWLSARILLPVAQLFAMMDEIFSLF